MPCTRLSDPPYNLNGRNVLVFLRFLDFDFDLDALLLCPDVDLDIFLVTRLEGRFFPTLFLVLLFLYFLTDVERVADDFLAGLRLAILYYIIYIIGIIKYIISVLYTCFLIDL